MLKYLRGMMEYGLRYLKDGEAKLFLENAVGQLINSNSPSP